MVIHHQLKVFASSKYSSEALAMDTARVGSTMNVVRLPRRPPAPDYTASGPAWRVAREEDETRSSPRVSGRNPIWKMGIGSYVNAWR